MPSTKKLEGQEDDLTRIMSTIYRDLFEGQLLENESESPLSGGE